MDAANREGAVTVYGAVTTGLREAFAPFERRFPNIKLDLTVTPSPDLVARLLAEREAKKFIPDVLVGPATQAAVTLKPANALAPLEPALVLREVVNPAAWFDNRLWWIDSAAPRTTLGFLGYVGTTLSYNSNQVDPKQFSSFTDLLDPKWRGGIVAYDIRRQGTGQSQTRFILQHPDLGLPFLRRLFTEMNITYSTDSRQMTDWLAQGRYLLGLWIFNTDLRTAQQQGLPVRELAGEQFREGAPITVNGGSVNLVESAPHVNAAKVFINWLLSREGQIAFQSNVNLPSLRLDTPKEGFGETLVPKAGVKYVNGSTEEYSRISIAQVVDIINEANKS